MSKSEQKIMSQTLQIKINYLKPVDVDDLKNAFDGLNKQYLKFKSKHGLPVDLKSSKLQIKNIDKGSLLIDLITSNVIVPPLIELALENPDAMLKFGEFLSRLFKKFLNKEHSTNTNLSEYQEVNQILQPIVKDSQGSISGIYIDGNNNQIQVFNINNTDANNIKEITNTDLAQNQIEETYNYNNPNIS